MNMFFSQGLISKKGPLRSIWIAAHFYKKLNKHQVNQTNIPASVDKILLDEVPVVTYRILAYLLLGIVRIYSKKVEYLFHDCHNVLTDIYQFAASKKATTPIKAIHAPYSSITLPGTFELDAFDLDVLEDANGQHVVSRELIMLEEVGKFDGMVPPSFDQYLCEEDAAHVEACSSAHSPAKHTRSLNLTNDDMLVCPSPQNLTNLETSMEKLRGYRFSLEECLDPILLPEAEEAQGHHTIDSSKLEVSMEKLRDYRFSLEERLDPMILDEADEHNPVKTSDEEHKPNDELMKSPGSEMIIGKEADQIKFLERTPLQSKKFSTTSESRPASITVDVTEPKVPNASGATTPEFMAVRTPAAKERSRVSMKRKVLFDDPIVIPNKVLKRCISDSSDLVCKRSKAPHTALDAWKRRRISNLPHSFLEPSIHCISLDLRSLNFHKKISTPEAVDTVETPANNDELGSPVIHRSLDQEAIAPSTPVSRATSLRFNEIHGGTTLDRARPAISIESIDDNPREDQDLDINVTDEELNSCEGDSKEKHKLSVRTRSVAKCLYRNFVSKNKRGEDEILNFSELLKRKTKRESSRLFYELLVLKSGGYVDVKQDKAYEDIFAVGTPNLKQACEADGA